MKGSIVLLFSAVILMTYLDYAEAADVKCWAGEPAAGGVDCPGQTHCMLDATPKQLCGDMTPTVPKCKEGGKIYCQGDDCNAEADPLKYLDAEYPACPTGPPPSSTGGTGGMPSTSDGGVPAATEEAGTSIVAFSALSILALSAIPLLNALSN